MKLIKWFYPGLKIKRWITLWVLGVFFILVSSPQVFTGIHLVLRILYWILFVIGIGLFIVGTAYLIRSFFEAIYPHKEKDLIDIIYEKRFLAKGPKIVAIGGGTGLSTILEGLKEYTSNITAIVAVADEGGSSGRLREEFGILPPGDIRNCLVSLAEAPQLMRDLFQYRFKEGEGMKGHSFGNIFITAMTQVTGSFKDAVEESSKVLAIRGRVIPASLDKIRLKAEYCDGSTKEGEDKIPKEEKRIRRISILPGNAKLNPEVLGVIREAEVIIFGPGSLFTSVLPNLLIEGISEEIAGKSALKIYICNVMTQNGETDGFTAADHFQMIESHTRAGLINACLVNAGRLEYRLLLKYAQEKSFPVIFDRERLRKMGVSVFEADVVSRDNYLRHNSKEVAREVIKIYNNYWKKRWKELKKKSW
ncbi:MAG: YvcK family protein [Candidatus Omnitrophota bacterium]|nr:MAG: YvcK family protein [Candidatus Omnitrophota bacterium]